MKKRQGLVIVNTGNGKGKTTAALGLALRAVGQGMKVVIRQFIKGSWKPGELKALKRLSPLVDIKALGQGFLASNMPAGEIEKQKAKEHRAFASLKADMAKLKPDMLILDEVLYLVHYGLLPEKELLLFIKEKPAEMHLVLTGRGLTRKVKAAADLVTEMKAVKHPYKKGIPAQKGVEF